MAAIDISRNHTLDLATAKERAEELAKDLEEKMSIRWHWEGDNIRFDANRGVAKGVKGMVIVTTSKVRVEIDLPFLLRAVKRSIAGKVESKLDKVLG